MLPEQNEILVDYLDNQLAGEQRAAAEQLLNNDTAAAEELQHLQFSVALVREAALLEQVKTVRDKFHAAAKVVPMQKAQGGAVVRSFSKNILRVAAMVVLVAGAASVYKYSVTDASAVFAENYSSFELSTSRGKNDDGALEQAYRNKDWKKVEDLSVTTSKTNKTSFLAGIAAMELKEYDKARSSFNEVLRSDDRSTTPFFQDEAEYYLAMADLASNRTTEGLSILNKIRSDKNHVFYKKANHISSLDLKVLNLKK